MVRAMLDNGLTVTLNSDDPAYMGGTYLNEVLVEAQKRSNLFKAELVRIERNAFRSAWLPDAARVALLAGLDALAAQWNVRDADS